MQGISTRSVDELVKAMGTSSISKMLGVAAVRVDRRTGPRSSPGRIVSKAVIIALAVNSEGFRERLGMAIGASEAEPFWTDFLRSLTRRGLCGVKPVISDAHEGLKAAAARVLAAINAALAKESFETASAQWRPVAVQLPGKFPKLAGLMDGAETDVLALITFPKAHQTQIHYTNPFERLNAEIRATHGCGRYLPERSLDHAACRRAAARAQRRVTTATSLHVP